MTTGSTAWGHSTGVIETNTRTFSSNWTGTGTISGTSDAEVINLNYGEYMTSEIINTGAEVVALRQNFYASGDDVNLYYRTAATEGGIATATWIRYTDQFTSLGYAQIKLDAGSVLTISETNPRYFIDGNGNPVILAGIQTWNDIQDMGVGSPPPVFDHAAYLDFAQARGGNVLRVWAWEQSRWSSEVDNTNIYFWPNVYARSSTPGNLDGGNKFDLDSFNQDYFDRLRARVLSARAHGFYCIVMFFNGWSTRLYIPYSPGYYQPFDGHPYNASNNINSIDGDTNDDGDGIEIQENSIPAVTAYQKALIAKFIDTLNDLDNVLWEVANEAGSSSLDWHEELIAYIHTYEATKPKQHLVGANNNYTVVESIVGVDWVSAGSVDPGMDAPPARAATRPNIMDSDHNGGIVNGWNPFRHFCQGHGGILYMDEYDGTAIGGGATGADTRATVVCEYTRYNLGYVLDYAARMDLLNCTPQGALCSTGYCLRKADAEYICYQPGSGDFTLNLTEASGTFNIEWLKCADGTVQTGGTTTGGATRTLTPPWDDAVAFLEK